MSKALQLRRKLLLLRHDSTRDEFLQETVHELETIAHNAQDNRRLVNERTAREQYRGELHEKLETYAAIKEADTVRIEQDRAYERAQAQQRAEDNRRKEARLREKTKDRIRAHKEQREKQALQRSAEERDAIREIQDGIRRLIIENKPHIERRYELRAAKEQRIKEKAAMAAAEAEQRQEKLRRLVESVSLSRERSASMTNLLTDTIP